MATLISQPNDILRCICEFLSFNDTLSLKHTSTRFVKILEYSLHKLDLELYLFEKQKDKVNDEYAIYIQQTNNYEKLLPYFNKYYKKHDRYMTYESPDTLLLHVSKPQWIGGYYIQTETAIPFMMFLRHCVGNKKDVTSSYVYRDNINGSREVHMFQFIDL